MRLPCIFAGAALALCGPAHAGSVALRLVADRAAISAADPTVTLTLWADVLTPGPQDIGFAVVRPGRLTAAGGAGGVLAAAPGLTPGFVSVLMPQVVSHGAASNPGGGLDPWIDGVSGYQDPPDFLGLGSHLNPNFNGAASIAVYRFRYTATDFTARTVDFGVLAPLGQVAAIYTSQSGASRFILPHDADYRGASVNVIDGPTIPLPTAGAMAGVALGLIGVRRRRVQAHTPAPGGILGFLCFQNAFAAGCP